MCHVGPKLLATFDRSHDCTQLLMKEAPLVIRLGQELAGGIVFRCLTERGGQSNAPHGFCCHPDARLMNLAPKPLPIILSNRSGENKNLPWAQGLLAL